MLYKFSQTVVNQQNKTTSRTTYKAGEVYDLREVDKGFSKKLKEQGIITEVKQASASKPVEEGIAVDKSAEVKGGK